MENIIKDVLLHDIIILEIEGIKYTVLKTEHRNGYDVQEIRIDGDELYYKMALHAIRRN